MEDNNQSVDSNQLQQPQPIPQPPFGDGSGVALQPKKNRKGLIIGIVVGVLLLIAIIAGLLIYFLWWQNPQKAVTDAVVNSITTKKFITSGKITAESEVGGGTVKMDMEIKSASDSDKSKADIKINMINSNSSFSMNLDLKGNVVVSGQEVYLKVDNLKSSISKVVDSLMEQMAKSYGYDLSDPVIKSQLEATKKQALGEINSKIDEFDGQWLKISPEDMDNDDSKCSVSVLSEFYKNDNFRREVAEAYRANSFLIVQDAKVEDRNNGRGFEVRGDTEKAKSFVKSLENSEFGKKLKDCDAKFDGTTDSTTTSNDVKTKLKVWVDAGHNLRAIEMDGNDDKYKLKAALDIEPGKTENIDIPSNAKRLKDVINRLNGSPLNSILPTQI